MTQPNESILRRIRALLALGSNNPNEHEAAAAAQKAMELMEQHNLDAATLGTETSSSTFGERKQDFVAGGLYGWQRNIWKAVAELNFCMYWAEKGLKKGDKYQHKLLGSPTNVLSTQLMAEYLQQAIERLAKVKAKDGGYNVFCREMIAYREGAAQNVITRLNQLRWERLEADRKKAAEEKARQSHPGYASSGTGLVLASVIQSEADYNNDYINGYEPGFTARNRAEWEAKVAARQAEHERRMAEDPEYAEAYNKAAEERTANNEAWWAEQARKDEARRRRNAGRDGYDENGYKYRYRNATPEEERANLRTYREGYDKGGSISLHQQVDKSNNAKLR